MDAFFEKKKSILSYFDNVQRITSMMNYLELIQTNLSESSLI